MFCSVCDIPNKIGFLAKTTELYQTIQTNIASVCAIAIVISEKSTGQKTVDEFQSEGIQLLLSE